MYNISFIIPVYNLKEDELRHCIESIVNQTCGNNEIIIIDDGSNNGIEACCDTLGHQYGVTVIHQPNQGLAVARNTGINASHGDWIVHVDGDDWVDIHLSEALIDASKKKMSDIYVWGFVLATGNIRRELLLRDKSAFEAPYGKLKEKILCSILDNNNSFINLSLNTSWGKAYRRSFLIGSNLYYEPRLRRAQDAAYNLRAFNEASSVGYIDLALNFYRNDNVSLSRGYNPKTYDYLLATALSVREFTSQDNIPERVEEASNIFIQRLFRMINVQHYQHRDNNLPYRVRKKMFLEAIETEPFRSAFSTGLTRIALVDRIADKLYQRKMFGIIALYDKLLSHSYKIKNIIK